MMNGNDAEHPENINTPNSHCVQIEPTSVPEETLRFPSKLGEITKRQVERVEEDYKLKLNLRAALDKVVTRFQHRSVVFVGYLSVLYTITFPCEMLNIFAVLIGLSWMGIILEGGLVIFHFWVIYKEDAMRRKDLVENLNTKKKGGSQSQANIGLPLSGESRTGESALDNNVGLVSSDTENGENCCHQFSTFWWCAGPHVIDAIVMFISAFAFVLILGIYIYTKICVDSVSPTPTPTPVSSDDMLFPIA